MYFKKQGSILIIVLLIGSIILLGGSQLVRLQKLQSQAVELRYYHLKSLYLSESGFAWAEGHFSKIPTLELSKISKDTILKNQGALLKIPVTLDGDIYIGKTGSDVISVGKVNNMALCIIRRQFQIENNKLTWRSWERL